MAVTLRAQRLIDAKHDLEKAKTLVSKIGALRELLAVPGVGRNYRRYAEKKLIEFRAEAAAAGNDELIRRLALLDERLVMHVEAEKSRLARKHAGQQKQTKKAATPAPQGPAPATTGLMELWTSMLEKGTKS